MSRHRLVRNLDYNGQPETPFKAYQTKTQPTTPSLAAELEEYDGFSDSQEDMTEEQQGAPCYRPCELLPP